MTTNSRPNVAFKSIAIIALIWNIIGIFSFIMNVSVSSESLQSLPEAERAIYESTPLWLKLIYGIAVVTGTLASVLLLMKKALAYKLFILSLIAIAIQMTYSVFFTKSVEVYGPSAMALPAFVTLFGLFLVFYSRACLTKGWLK